MSAPAPTCADVRERLVDLARGAPGGAEPEIAAHAASCPACRAEVAATAEVLALVRRLPQPAPGPGFRARVLRAAGIVSGRRPAVRVYLRDRIRNAPIWAAAIVAHAAVFLVLAGIAITTVVAPRTVVVAGGFESGTEFEEETPIPPIEKPPIPDAPRGPLPTPPIPELESPADRPPLPVGPDPVGPGARTRPPRPEWERLPLSRRSDPHASAMAWIGRRLTTESRMGRRTAAGGDAWTEPIARGLAWLRATQVEDGSWDPAAHGGSAEYRVGLAALALLAFAAEGAGAVGEDANSVTARRAATFLRESQDRETGLFGPAGAHRLYNHGLALLALAEVHGLDLARRHALGTMALRPALERGVAALARAQLPGGGWGYAPGARTADTSVTAWQVEALAACRILGVDPPPGVLDGARAWLRSVADPTGRFGYRRRGDHPRGAAALAAAGAVAAALLAEPEPEGAAEGRTALLLRALPASSPDPDRYLWWHATTWLHDRATEVGEDESAQARARAAWTTWRVALGKALVPSQEADGSWAPRDRYGEIGGRVYATAMSVLCLETPSR
ncbi:MAG: hypothetical protein L0216_21840 [Planctomycetales bacterium]|nr:hypothetical protein [Planctomycetales bacterium]